MQISNAKVALMLLKVELVREQLAATCVGKPEPALRVMDLHHVIQEMYGLQIDMKEVSFTAAYLKGHVLRYQDSRAVVMVRANLSKADKRIVTVKELCHLFLDEKEDWSTDGVSIIDSMIDEVIAWSEDEVGLTDPSSPLQSELMAMLAATELAYPHEYRAADLAKLERNETTVQAIALQHDVPPFIIEHAYRNQEMLDRARALNEKNKLAAE